MLNIDIRILTLFHVYYFLCLLGMLNIDIRIQLNSNNSQFSSLLGMLNIDIRIPEVRGYVIGAMFARYVEYRY